MKIFISETDRQDAHRIALKNIAGFYAIPNWNTENNAILYQRLKELTPPPPILKPLTEYLNAYDDWFKFYKDKKDIEITTGKEYELNEEERIELTGLIQQRENKRKELQNMFDKLQFDRFKRFRGLENVEGLAWDESGVPI